MPGIACAYKVSRELRGLHFDYWAHAKSLEYSARIPSKSGQAIDRLSENTLDMDLLLPNDNNITIARRLSRNTIN